MFEVFINKTVKNGNIVDVNRSKPLYDIMEPLLGKDVLELLNGNELIKKVRDMLNQSNMFISL